MSKRKLAMGIFGTTSVMALIALIPSCSSDDTTTTRTCTAIAGTPWTPSIPGTGASNHSTTTTVTTTSQTATGTVIGFAQAAPASVELSVPIDMTADLGPMGSLTLEASVSGYPSDLQGSAFPLLVSLNDGTNEYINLARTGTGGDCAASGYYNNQGTQNTNCVINLPSAYTNRAHWEQHQEPNSSAANSPSVNTFPTCNWPDGSSSSSVVQTGDLPQNILYPQCSFTQVFFTGSPARLRFGVTYTAKYVLMADSYTSVPAGQAATLNVTVVKKTNTATTIGGAFDLNLILVGTQNVTDSRTAKGQQNLNTLVSNLTTFYGQTNTGFKIGNVNAVEFGCNTNLAADGTAYGDLKVSEFNSMLGASGTIVSSNAQGKAINVFLVSSITDDLTANSNFTILGYDGQINGPPLNGTASSGVTASTSNQIASFNSSCTGTGICDTSVQDQGFYQLSQILAHEIGHFLGLNHPSELDGSVSDPVPDTNVCEATESVGGSNIITQTACAGSDPHIGDVRSQTCPQECPGYDGINTFCPSVPDCSFNQIMWWTVKNFQGSTINGDGNQFTPDEAAVMNYSSLIQ